MTIDYDIDRLISLLPLQKLENKGDCYTCLCPYHNDNDPSLSIIKGINEKKQFKGLVKCWSCGKTTNVSVLTKDLLGVSMYELLGITQDYNTSVFINNLQDVEPPVDWSDEFENKTFNDVIIDGQLLDVYDNYELLDYLYTKRNINNAFIQTFNLKYIKKAKVNNKTWIIDRFVIPVYKDKKMISLEARTYKICDFKKVIYPKNSSVNYLFNYDNINKTKLVYIVEGIMGLSSVWQIDRNVISTFGKVLTPYQKYLINQLPYICIIPDNDFPKKDNLQDALAQYDDFYHTEYQVCVIEKNETDPNDIKLDELSMLMNNKKPSTEILLDKYGILPKTNKVQW